MKTQFLDFLIKIPDAVWAAVIASLLTLGGVLFTNRGSYKRLLKQLEHDSLQKDRERNMGIRRQVYLDAAEAITEMHNIINKMCNLSISDADISMTVSKSSAIVSKVYVICSSETINSISKLMSAFTCRYLEILSERIPLIRRQLDIDIQNELILKSSKDRDQLLEIMKNLRIQGVKDARLEETIKNNFDFQQDQISKLIQKQKDLIEINRLEQGKLAIKCFQASKEISEYFPSAINSVRKEMDIPFDEEAYRNVISKQWEESEKSLKDFYNKIVKG
jgi:hypothetical protein